MIKYNAAEQKVKLQSQLFEFDKQHGISLETLKIVGDQLPGVVLVNDMRTLKNVYMNRFGCDYLQKSSEELQQMGPEYFIGEIFCPEEISKLSSTFEGLIKRNDVTELTGFYQKVRPNRQTDWKHFYLSGKLLEHDSGYCIHLGMAASADNANLHLIGKKLDVDSASPVQFQQFNSLTKREKQILGLVAKGYTNATIADQLFLALYTIETHRKNINRKLGTKNIRDLIVVAERFGL